MVLPTYRMLAYAVDFRWHEPQEYKATLLPGDHGEYEAGILLAIIGR